eukprot:CAMPEP_0203670470 /NCGR_PEP_ID=MMETSP0090-20130426/6533_1 /ASSEMBLY_ACC=CAM_ASM_001088 /TAXON_ID=426623 /ORGANISM="Chaetoceros affinis, Strain CCMP159" /LENGTH=428 /DNA_ID=CAMNT_0050535335 /DNA_START=18 /DNA_END=1301 /DNA_ORIENTATION=+
MMNANKQSRKKKKHSDRGDLSKSQVTSTSTKRARRNISRDGGTGTCTYSEEDDNNRSPPRRRLSTGHSSSITSQYGNCSNVSLRYKKQCRIGQGTYGIVYKALDTQTNQTVALKRCLPHHEDTDGFPITTLREIQILKEIHGHPNIIQLKEVTVSSKQSGVFLVFEYAHFDLAHLIDEHYSNHKRSPFTVPETKCLAEQLLCAIEYLHGRCIIHRDLKLSNLLYNKERGTLKLCDFGLARKMSKLSSNVYKDKDKYKYAKGAEMANLRNDRNAVSKIIPSSPPSEHLTPKVVSLWYRPPELLLNSECYDFAVDLWGSGCVIAELLLGVPLFNGDSEMNQLHKIVDLLGQPNLNTWPGLKDMPLFKDGNFELQFCASKSTKRSSHNGGKSKFLDMFSNLSTAGILLLSNLLEYDPSQRLSAKDAHACTW